MAASSAAAILHAYHTGQLGQTMLSPLDRALCGHPLPQAAMLRLSDQEIGLAVQATYYDKQTADQIKAQAAAQEIADAEARRKITAPAWPNKEMRRRLNPWLNE